MQSCGEQRTNNKLTPFTRKMNGYFVANEIKPEWLKGFRLQRKPSSRSIHILNTIQ